jgi:hypothetical protein
MTAEAEMQKTIEGLPEFLTRDQYVCMFSSFGLDPRHVVELRLAHDGVHALVFALDEQGKRIYEIRTESWMKHRVFVPVRKDDADERTSRVTPVEVAR